MMMKAFSQAAAVHYDIVSFTVLTGKLVKKIKNNNKYLIEATLKYRLQTIQQFLCVLFQVGYTVIYLLLYLLNEEINTGMSEKKNKSTLFSS